MIRKKDHGNRRARSNQLLTESIGFFFARPFSKSLLFLILSGAFHHCSSPLPKQQYMILVTLNTAKEIQNTILHCSKVC
ncbi:hypothetical protein NQ318_022508 [Aromia moschata]|uniref:Uncharacterized protein n=1 Tax=Aromia moschata TaxID=1265417 RepID=A0AAV8Z5B3_9CUCU|nr:hypothetical protein NQ318_022508 [Aromia moschata]